MKTVTQTNSRQWAAKDAKQLFSTIGKVRTWAGLKSLMTAVVNNWIKEHEKNLNKALGIGMRNGVRYDRVVVPNSADIRIMGSMGFRGEFRDVDSLPFGRDYRFNIRVSIKTRYKGRDGGEDFKDQLNFTIGSIGVERMYNCCGMAVITNLTSYVGRPDSKVGAGVLMTYLAEVLARSQKYMGVTLTNRIRSSKRDVLHRMGYKTVLEWHNIRSGQDLFQASKDMKASSVNDFNTFQFLVGKSKDTIQENAEKSGIDKVVDDLIKKPKPKQEKEEAEKKRNHGTLEQYHLEYQLNRTGILDQVTSSGPSNFDMTEEEFKENLHRIMLRKKAERDAKRKALFSESPFFGNPLSFMSRSRR
jgi:hypothetical protein